MRFGDEPSRLLLAATEQRLFVLNRGSDTITMLSVPGLQDMGRIPVSPGPRALVRDERTGYLYVACEAGGEVVGIEDAHGRRQILADRDDGILYSGPMVVCSLNSSVDLAR